MELSKKRKKRKEGERKENKNSKKTTHQVLDELVLPMSRSVANEGSSASEGSLIPFWMPLSTPYPPA